MKDAIKLAKAALKHAEQNISAAYKAEGLAFKHVKILIQLRMIFAKMPVTLLLL